MARAGHLLVSICKHKRPLLRRIIKPPGMIHVPVAIAQEAKADIAEEVPAEDMEAEVPEEQQAQEPPPPAAAASAAPVAPAVSAPAALSTLQAAAPVQQVMEPVVDPPPQPVSPTTDQAPAEAASGKAQRCDPGLPAQCACKRCTAAHARPAMLSSCLLGRRSARPGLATRTGAAGKARPVSAPATGLPTE